MAPGSEFPTDGSQSVAGLRRGVKGRGKDPWAVPRSAGRWRRRRPDREACVRHHSAHRTPRTLSSISSPARAAGGSRGPSFGGCASPAGGARRTACGGPAPFLPPDRTHGARRREGRPHSANRYRPTLSPTLRSPRRRRPGSTLPPASSARRPPPWATTARAARRASAPPLPSTSERPRAAGGGHESPAARGRRARRARSCRTAHGSGRSPKTRSLSRRL